MTLQTIPNMASDIARLARNGSFYIESTMTGHVVIWVGEHDPPAEVTGVATVYQAKARLAPNRDSNTAARQWCAEHGLPVQN